jgi:hypothetical protein
MLLHATSRLRDWTGEAVISDSHPAVANGMPVLLIDDNPVEPEQTDWAGYEILAATPNEREALRRGSYHFRAA